MTNLGTYFNQVSLVFVNNRNLLPKQNLGSWWYEEYVRRLHIKEVSPEKAAKIIERAYSLFHHNATNRWRRWDYVKPEVGTYIQKVIGDGELPYPKYVTESFINLTEERFKRGTYVRWYPIPKF